MGKISLQLSIKAVFFIIFNHDLIIKINVCANRDDICNEIIILFYFLLDMQYIKHNTKQCIPLYQTVKVRRMLESTIHL